MFKSKHWDQCANYVNKSKKENILSIKSSKTCKKNGIFEKEVKKELGNWNQSGGVRSKWSLMFQMGKILRQIPKVKGIPGALDGGIK